MLTVECIKGIKELKKLSDVLYGELSAPKTKTI